MKELLHSKLFRHNLYKWLFMYVGVMCLLTSVITYSKYISSMQGADTARAAKFNVLITYDKVCEGGNVACDYGSLRPTETIEYYFTVDTTELEVKTLLITNINVHDDFTNIKLYDAECGNLFTNYEKDGNNLIITETIIPENNNYVRKYKLECIFDKSLDSGYESIHDYSDALIVGYSATQIK